MKKFKLFISVVLICCLSVSLFACSNSNHSTHSYDEIYNAVNASLDIGDDGIFTILKINDTHLYNGTGKNDKKTLEALKRTLDNNSYDMIIVDGDLVDGFNNKLSYNKYKAADKFGELIESYNVPWIFVPGNNDGEKDGTTEDFVAYLMQFDHLLYGNEKEIAGAMQFFIDLTKNGETVHSIAILDSLAQDGDGNYDSIKENQIEWLLNGINSRKVKTSVFFHMPTPAFKTAYENGTAYEGYPFADPYAVDDIPGNKLFDEKTADNKYISLISVAHVHSDNIAYYYNNRYYQLSSLGGYNAVGSGNTAPSYTLITIDTNQQDNQKMYTFEKIYVN